MHRLLRRWRRWDLSQTLAWTNSVRSWFEIPEHVHSVGVALLYVQVACSLVGCLGNVYTGVPIADLAVTLFALVAVESASQRLLLVYAVLLPCSLITDVLWFVLVARELRSMSQRKSYMKMIVLFQAISFTFRMLSIVVWVHVYKQSPNSDHAVVDFASRIRSFNSEAPDFPSVWHEGEEAQDYVGGSIYDPVYYSSLFAKSPETEQLILRPHFEGP